MRRVMSLLWLLVATVCDSAMAAASCSTDPSDVVLALACEHFARAEIEFEGTDRVLVINLQDPAVSGKEIAALLTQLALEDADTDLVLLREVRIKNGHAADKLELRDLTIPWALSFRSMTLDDGVTFDNMNFTHKVVFDHTNLRGKLFIDRSSFEQGLSIVGESLLAPLLTGDDKTTLHVNKTKIDRDMLILGAKLDGVVEFYDNQIGSALRIEDTELRKGVKIRDNSLEDLLVYRTTFEKYLRIYSNEIDRLELKDNTKTFDLAISQNHIQNMSELSDIVLSGSPVEFIHNTVERQLYFTPKVIANDVRNIDLYGNTVRGVAIVTIPESRVDAASSRRWQPLMLDISNSTFNSLLQVRLDRRDGGISTAPPPPEDYCFRDDRANRVLSIDLTAVEAASFDWAVPLDDCRFDWTGSGFRYHQWISGADGTHPSDDPLDWRLQISAPQPSALLYMSEHLRGRGRFTDSRNVIFEAKKMDYQPGASCAPRWNIFSSEFWDPNTCTVQRLRYWFLYTSGFGVKPEYGLYFLVCIWFGGAVFYFVYFWIMRALNPEDRPIVVVPIWFDRRLDWLYRQLYRAWVALRRQTNQIDVSPAGALGAVPGAAEPGSGFRPRRPGTDIIGCVSGANPPGMRPPEGFKLYQQGQEPKDLSLWVFSLDAALPVVNLHAYDAYFPDVYFVRAFSFLQHGFGWWIATSLLASLALL
jgi:hypothetical protein